MTWVRVDDAAPLHPKLLKAGPEAAWLWVCGLAHCNRSATDGVIEKVFLPALFPSGAWNLRRLSQLADRLVEVRLWIDCGESYRVHQYEDQQETAMKEQVEARREYDRSRKKALRAAQKSGTRPANVPDTSAAKREVSPDPGPARPVPYSDPSLREGSARTSEDSAKVMGLARPSMPRLALVQAMAAKYSERVLALTGKHWAGPSVIEAIGRGAPPLANRNAAEHLDSLAAWAESDPDPLALFVRVLDGAAADEWVASKGLPLKSLAENPARWVSAIKAASKDGPQPPSDASKFRPMSREERRARMTGGAS